MKDHTAPAADVAGLGRRLGSLCYEVVLLAAILFVAGWIFLVVDPLLPLAFTRPFFQLYLLIVTAAYFIYCWTRGQTLPMKTWRIRLVTIDGTAISTTKAARRYIFALASVALCAGGFGWALIDRNGQFLHDRLAGTRLIKDEG